MSISSADRWSQIRQVILESGKYPPELWEQVEAFAESYLIQGRPNFDVPHTHGVVAWAYQLATKLNTQMDRGDVLPNEPVDIPVLITAAWLHDIGYYGQFENVATHAEVQDIKARHMLVGAELAQKFLLEKAASIFTSQQIDLVVHLVRIHDDLDQISTNLETLLVEADTLGMLDVNWVEPTYQGEEALTFPDKPKTQKRFQLFRSPHGREALPQVVQAFRQFVLKRDFPSQIKTR